MKNGSAFSPDMYTPEVFPSPYIGTRINMPSFATTRNFRDIQYANMRRRCARREY